MKKLSIYLFLILFSLSAPSFANDIRDYEIDGVKIYDNIYDILPEVIISTSFEKIKDSKLYSGSTEFP